MSGESAFNVTAEVLQQAVEAANDAIIITTVDLDAPGPTIVYVNPGFERMTGYSRDEVVGKSPRLLQGPETSRELLDRLRRDLTEKQSFFGETINYRKDGSTYSVEWRIAPIRDAQGTVTHWAAIQRDITDRVRYEQELERRVKERTRELEGFTYTVSHDFRGPLRAIMSASMILIEDFSDKLDDEGKAELKRQSNAAKKLSNLMEDILRLSRLGRQEMAVVDLDVTALAREVSGEVVRRSGGEATVEVREGMRARGDANLVRLLFQNLVENAVKFARKDVPMRIEIGQDADGFFVRDNGIGFDNQYLERIFLPFERLNREDEYPGSGVGLTNVKRIVDRHEGRITADGVPGEGATFRFTLNLR
ncbi:MAG: sensor histidine kinase [Fimbriimonas sp.]